MMTSQTGKTEGQSISGNRSDMRSKIFATKRKIVTVQAFDMDIEIHQPSIREALTLADEDSNMTMTDMIIACCFVPNTEEPIFDIADRETLSNLPFGEDVTAITKAITDLTGGGDTKEQAKKS